jgi:hypothetical protein
LIEQLAHQAKRIDLIVMLACRERQQTRMCRFPASGSSRKSFARGCVPMDDPRCWQRVTREEIIQSIPVEPTPTIPTRQPFLPDPDDLIGVPATAVRLASQHTMAL